MNLYSLTKKNKIVFIVFVCLLLPFLFGAKILVSAYVPSQEKDPKCEFKIDNLSRIDPKYEPKEILNQGETRTCYGHAAYYLLQYYFNVLKAAKVYSEDINNISLSDVLLQGCNKTFKNGWYPFAVLHNVKNQSIIVNAQYPIENIFKFKNYLLKHPSCEKQDIWLAFNKIFENHVYSNLSADIRLIVESLSKEEISAETIFNELNKEQDTIIFHPYNVQVFEVTDNMITHLQSSNSEEMKKQIFKEKVRNLLAPAPPDGVPFPVTLTFCPQELIQNGSSTCNGFHAVAISGVRQTCCNNCFDSNHSKIQENWIEEWEIVNSYGGQKSGWYKADPLANSAIKYNKDASFIRPCGTSSPCKPEILGPFPLHYLVTSGDFKTLTQLISSKTKDLNLNVNSTDQSNSTLINLAASENNAQIASYLIEYGNFDPNLINIADIYGNTPLHYAAMYHNFELVELLLKHNANKNIVNKSGKTPLDYASEDEYSDIKDLLTEIKHSVPMLKPKISGTNIMKPEQKTLQSGPPPLIQDSKNELRSVPMKKLKENESNP